MSAESELLFEAVKNYFIWIVLALIAVAFTWHVVSWSEQHGKLAMPPDYDDSHSLVEGAVRLLNFQNSGLGAAWDEYRLRNPHSFLHYYWTAALFAVFGIHESVPYWANAVFLFGVLGAFVSMLPRGLPIAWKLVWAAAFLGMPVCFHVVFDFRSEVTMAVLLFMGCACALEWAWGHSRSGLWFFATAVCFALALAMKPVMFPYQLGMLGLCSMVYLASKCFVDKGQALSAQPPDPIGLKLVKASLWLSALWTIVLLPSIPHFWIYRADIFGYILGVAFESDFYKLNEQQGAQWSFHWLGYSGVWHLGKLNWIFAILLFMGLLAGSVPSWKGLRLGARWNSLAFLTLGAFGGIAINAVHQPWFGMTFQLLLVASALGFLAHLFQWEKTGLLISSVCVAALGAWWLYDAHNRIYIAVLALALLIAGLTWVGESRPKWAKIFAAGVLLLVLCYGLTLSGFIFQAVVIAWVSIAIGLIFRFTPNNLVSFVCTGLLAMLVWGKMERAPYHNYVQRTLADSGGDGLEWRRAGARKVFEMINASWDSRRVPVIWCSSYGWVDGNTIAWEAVKQQKAWKAFNKAELKAPAGEKVPLFADFLVISNSKLLGYIKTPGSDSEIQGVSELLLAYPSLNLIGEISDPSGEKITVIKNSSARNELGPDWLKRKVQASLPP